MSQAAREVLFGERELLGPSRQNSLRLRSTIRLAQPYLAGAIAPFWAHSRLAELFEEYLFYVLCSARGSLGLMAAALRRSEELAPGDAMASRLADYYSTHYEEEKDHASWLIADLQALGVDQAEIDFRPTPGSVASMVGAQYVWTLQHHPAAPLGFFAVLEGFPPLLSELEEVRQRTGLPAEAFRFLAAHAEIDPHHAADLYRLLDELSLDERQMGLVGLSALHTMTSLAAIFEELASPGSDGR